MLQPTARPRRALASILILFVCLATLYSVVNPLFEAPDELWHYGVVQHLRTGQGLPVLVTGQSLAPPAQEAVQPPLYYALAAALTFWVPVEDLGRLARLNPAGLPLDPASGGKRNFVILLRPDSFPYSGEFLAAHLARLLSVAIGALTVVATWAIAREVAPGRPGVWTLAAALNAFIPQFVFTSSAVSNDGLATCIASWGLLLSIRAAQRPPSIGRAAALGALAGLGALTKLSDLALVPLGLVALAIAAWGELERRPSGAAEPAPHPSSKGRGSRPPLPSTGWGGLAGARPGEGSDSATTGPGVPRAGLSASRLSVWLRALVPSAAAFVGVALAVPSWWLVRNVRLYGDPLAFRAFVLASGGTGESRLVVPDPVDALAKLKTSFWAVFGWLNVPAEPAVYAFFDVVTIAALCGLVGLAARLARRGPTGATRAPGRARLVPVGVAALWIAMIGVAFARYQFSLVAFHGRLLFPALAAICVLLALGLASLPWRRARTPALAGVIGLTFAIAAVSPFRYIAPAYAHPPFLSEQALAEIAHRTDVRFGGELDLLGYDLPKSAVGPGEELEIALYWRAVVSIRRDYVASVQLLGPGNSRLAQEDRLLGLGGYPTSLWRAGDAFRETYRLRVPSDAAGPALSGVRVAVYPSGQTELQAEDGRGHLLGEVVPAHVKLIGPRADSAGVGVADFGGEVRLDGYRLEQTEVAPGGVIRGELRWSALRPPRADYTVFVQLVGPTGLVAQHDAQPRGGAYPTSYWEPGEEVRDEFALEVGADTEPGEYRLIAGMYELASGRRLPTGEGDSVTLGTLRVTPRGS